MGILLHIKKVFVWRLIGLNWSSNKKNISKEYVVFWHHYISFRSVIKEWWIIKLNNWFCLRCQPLVLILYNRVLYTNYFCFDFYPASGVVRIKVTTVLCLLFVGGYSVNGWQTFLKFVNGLPIQLLSCWAIVFKITLTQNVFNLDQVFR